MSGIEDQGMRPRGVENPPDDEPDESSDDRGGDVDEVPAGRAGADSGATDAVRIDPEDESGIPDSSPMNDEPGVGPGNPRP